jgi:hypothetical protein
MVTPLLQMVWERHLQRRWEAEALENVAWEIFHYQRERTYNEWVGYIQRLLCEHLLGLLAAGAGVLAVYACVYTASCFAAKCMCMHTLLCNALPAWSTACRYAPPRYPW